MANIYKNELIDLTTTDNTVIYTTPADSRAIIKSILVSEDAGSGSTLTFTITSSTDKKDTRARGRFISVKIENDAASESWRFGTLRLDIQPDGRR